MVQTMPYSMVGARELIATAIRARLTSEVMCDLIVHHGRDCFMAVFRTGTQPSVVKLIDRNDIDNGPGALSRKIVAITEEALVELGVKPRAGVFDGADEYEEILAGQAAMEEIAKQAPQS